MAIYNSKSNTCECYEIKHSRQIVPMQTRYLVDEERLTQTSKRFGKISKRCVLLYWKMGLNTEMWRNI